MARTRRRRLAVLAASLLLASGVFLSAGCEKQVISDTTYSSSQFPEYSHLPRTKTWGQRPEEESSFLEDVGGGFKKLFGAIGKLNPFRD